ncbi:hypothetical protein ACFLRA_00985 [Bdellovibrionota bacterium]
MKKMFLFFSFAVFCFLLSSVLNADIPGVRPGSADRAVRVQTIAQMALKCDGISILDALRLAQMSAEIKKLEDEWEDKGQQIQRIVAYLEEGGEVGDFLEMIRDLFDERWEIRDEARKLARDFQDAYEAIKSKC